MTWHLFLRSDALPVTNPFFSGKSLRLNNKNHYYITTALLPEPEKTIEDKIQVFEPEYHKQHGSTSTIDGELYYTRIFMETGNSIPKMHGTLVLLVTAKMRHGIAFFRSLFEH